MTLEAKMETGGKNMKDLISNGLHTYVKFAYRLSCIKT